MLPAVPVVTCVPPCSGFAEWSLRGFMVKLTVPEECSRTGILSWNCDGERNQRKRLCLNSINDPALVATSMSCECENEQPKSAADVPADPQRIGAGDGLVKRSVSGSWMNGNGTEEADNGSRSNSAGTHNRRAAAGRQDDTNTGVEWVQDLGLALHQPNSDRAGCGGGGEKWQSAVSGRAATVTRRE